MRLAVRLRRTATIGAVTIVLSGLAAIAQAQPGQPVVQINPDFTVTVSYSAPTPPPASGALLAATYEGIPVPGSPFNIGQSTTITAGPLIPGTYSVQVVWGAVASPPTTFVMTTVLGAPNLRAAGVDLATVQLAWDPASGVVAGHDVEATVLGTGQVVTFPVGSQPGVIVNGVAPGRYSVRVRARNAFGVGPFSNAITVEVGSVLAQGDLQVTLTWNTTVDMDLHVLEPNGAHVFHGNMVGPSARMDFDDFNGFGPENIFVSAGRAYPGIYLIAIVHNSQDVETTSTVSVTLGAGSDNAKTVIFTRRTNRAASRTAALVAQVNVLTGEVVEWLGTTRVP